ncbi:MAG: Asp-tRNA(Asn)/Glu-tRNA(Gln) amidotransferase subunit GatA [Sulfolobales archaeon]|nr:Asp-tRNA(Asn)/Glu-tRNA(Gln) amidotransferase subunit GatA [Sulfolobales archaeon]MCX8186370.1 Asp-tRNA(Asn)/Glu-tRNA(Gln) amidotransferase subunit GatA [Sulfolobales archaeon]MDW7968895.1 Asp-tRNA(Asn)/Glu-tRNA(Gln) amidotransferase subunit GatA [Sulfolobales archaeon]
MDGLELVKLFHADPSLIYEYVIETYELIRKVEDSIKSYITLKPLDEVLKECKIVSDKIKDGFKGRLAGLLIAVKDVISTKGLLTTCGSKMLSNYIPPYDATVIERVSAEGGIIIGKTNMDEFAMGSTTENSAFFITRNPWDLSRVPGGSSGGSATAVSAYEATISLGSDTGGSVRLPASYTGTVGVKPTYGLVSRYGLISYGTSLEQVGPIVRDVSDAALILSVLSGHDPRDSTSLKVEAVDYTTFLKPIPLKKYRVAIIKECINEGVDSSVLSSFNKSIYRLENEGFEVSEVSIPIIRYALPTYYIIAMAEASSNLSRYDGIRYGYHVDVENKLWDEAYTESRSYGFGLEVKKRILLGTFVLSAGYYDQYYLKASKVRKLLYDEFSRILSHYDVVITPTAPSLPPRIGEAISDPMKLYLSDIYTATVNLIGLPAMSIPADIVNDLPVGIQLIGPRLSEGSLINIAYIHEVKSGLKNLIPTAVRPYV